MVIGDLLYLLLIMTESKIKSGVIAKKLNNSINSTDEEIIFI